MKNVFVVLSPVRSGSSCVARALQALGVDLGTDLVAPTAHNPKGFFEDNGVNAINVKLYEYVKRAENGEHSLNPLNSDTFSSACDLLESRFKSCSNYGFKNPRTAQFLPFWQKVFAALNLNDSYAIAIRNPLCCAHSMTSASFETVFVGWLSCLLPVCEFTKNKKRVVVDYDEMMDSPHKQLERISNALGLSHLKNENEWKVYCDEFLEKSLQHHQYTFEQLKSHPRVFPLCTAVYSYLLMLARDETDFQKEDFQIKWKAVEEGAKQTFRSYVHMAVTMKNYEQQLKKAQDLCTQYEKSLSWRITRPLRTMKKFFTDHPKM